MNYCFIIHLLKDLPKELTTKNILCYPLCKPFCSNTMIVNKLI